MLNYGRPGRGPSLRQGPGPRDRADGRRSGSRHTRVLDDGWTVVDRRTAAASAHFEHTVASPSDGPWVLTALDGGAGAPRPRSASRGAPQAADLRGSGPVAVSALRAGVA